VLLVVAGRIVTAALHEMMVWQQGRDQIKAVCSMALIHMLKAVKIHHGKIDMIMYHITGS
jgi:hypothetical protein